MVYYWFRMAYYCFPRHFGEFPNFDQMFDLVPLICCSSIWNTYDNKSLRPIVANLRISSLFLQNMCTRLLELWHFIFIILVLMCLQFSKVWKFKTLKIWSFATLQSWDVLNWKENEFRNHTTLNIQIWNVETSFLFSFFETEPHCHIATSPHSHIATQLQSHIAT